MQYSYTPVSRQDKFVDDAKTLLAFFMYLLIPEILLLPFKEYRDDKVTKEIAASKAEEKQAELQKIKRANDARLALITRIEDSVFPQWNDMLTLIVECYGINFPDGDVGAMIKRKILAASFSEIITVTDTNILGKYPYFKNSLSLLEHVYTDETDGHYCAQLIAAVQKNVDECISKNKHCTGYGKIIATMKDKCPTVFAQLKI